MTTPERKTGFVWVAVNEVRYSCEGKNIRPRDIGAQAVVEKAKLQKTCCL